MKKRVIFTHNPYKSVWEHLRLLSRPASARRLLDGTMATDRKVRFPAGPTLHQKARQVAYSIAQAGEYYSAADKVSLTTSPVLYFYGMLSLAKALVVANEADTLLDDIRYHGLSSRPTSDPLTQLRPEASSWSLEPEFAVVREGVYTRLTQVTQGFHFEDYTVITLKSLLSVDPEISHIYWRLHGQPPVCHYLYDYQESSDPFAIELCPQTTDKDLFETKFPQLRADFDLLPELRHSQALVYRSKPHVGEKPPYFGIYWPSPGGKYIVGALPISSPSAETGRYHRPELCDYILMYILSNCVRYKQELWGSVIQGEVDGSLGLISLAISNAKLRFPSFVLANLFNEQFEFGTGAYFS